jgi:UDP-N-acetylglucosamine:LPS N-acetylglucosamine transferase
MKKYFITLSLGIISLLTLTGLLCAEESKTYMVTATIPAIPGLNAPLSEEFITKILTAAPEDQKTLPDENAQQEKNNIWQESSQATQLARNTQQKTLVYTYYSR